MKKISLIILLIALLSLAACDGLVPVGPESSSEAASAIIITPSVPDETSPEASTAPAVSEESGVTEAPSEEVSEPVSEPESGHEYGIDITPYLKYICPENDSEYTILVNYDHRLTDAYAPADLVGSEWTRSDRKAETLRKSAAMALDAFLKEAALNGINDVTVTSAYRSYTYQKWLFNYYVDQYLNQFADREACEKYVMTFSCREGCSEHQTGLACDMHNLSAASVAFGDTPAAKWLADNAYRFGFILRFPKEKESITGIEYEPWHFRFVGRAAATLMYEKGICLEEYYDLYGPAADEVN